MTYFDKELRTVSIYVVLAIIVGYLSFTFNHVGLAVALAVVVFFLFYGILKKTMKIEEDKKWWFTIAIEFFLLWIVVWTIFYNTVVL